MAVVKESLEGGGIAVVIAPAVHQRQAGRKLGAALLQIPGIGKLHLGGAEMVGRVKGMGKLHQAVGEAVEPVNAHSRNGAVVAVGRHRPGQTH